MTILRQRRMASITLLSATALFSVSCLAVTADEQPPSGARLRNEQESISGRYARFERVLTQMADILGYEDPERAELLRRAISESREKGIALTLEQIAGDLGRSEFGNAIDKQKTVTTDLRELLKLLQSEDRMSAVERERQRIADLLNDVNNLKARQRAVRARTQNSAAPSSAAPGQQQAQEDAEDILGEMNEHDGTGDSDNAAGDPPKDGEPTDRASGNSSPSGSGEDGRPSGNNEGTSPGEGDPQAGDPQDEPKDGEPTDGKRGEGEPKEGEPKEGEPKDGEPKDGEPNDGEPNDGEPGEAGEPKENGGDSSAQPQDSSQTPSEESGSGNESESQDSQSQSSPSSPSQSGPQDNQAEQTPGKEQLKTASNLMMEALDELREQEREAAVAKQDEAISELQKAAAELETMLQQLREEEKEMVLATLEARFQRLLSLQTRIYEGTVDLAATPRENWLDNAVSECRELSQEQLDATQECSFTTSLLREDGTSVSILVAVEDIETDMGAIAERLQQTKVGPLTQSMETDVIEALKELIEATQREMAEMKEQQNQPPPQQQDPNAQKPPLVQFMEEIKVLRSLQQRVNRRTRQVNGLLDDVSPDDVADLTAQLDELARRQERLRQSALKLAEQMEKQ